MDAAAAFVSVLVRLRHLFERPGSRTAHHRKINCGSGNAVFSGWTNVDYRWTGLQLMRRSPRPQLLADLTKALPADDDSISHIYANNFLEHLSYVEGERFLREAHRVMEPGGRIRIVVPDIARYVEAYIGNDQAFVKAVLAATAYWPDYVKDSLTLLDTIVRGSEEYGWVHKASYDSPLLHECLARLGFVRAHDCRAGESDDPTFRGLDGPIFACVIVEAEVAAW